MALKFRISLHAALNGCTLLLILRNVTTNGQQYYASNRTDKRDHATSGEKCASMSGTLLEIQELSNLTTLRQELNLPRNTMYWLGTKPPYMDAGSCIALSVPPKIKDTVGTVVQNCSRLNGYICEIFSQNVVTISTLPATVQGTPRLFRSDSSIQPSFTSPVHESVTESHLSSATYFIHSLTDSKPLIHLSAYSVPQITSLSAYSVPQITSLSAYSVPQITSLSAYSVPQITSVSPLKINTDLSTSPTRVCGCYSSDVLLSLCNNASVTSSLNLTTITESLYMDRKLTGRSVRRLNSATDTRTSSRVIGTVAAVVITAVPVFVILLDLPILIKHRRGCKRDTSPSK